MASSTLRRLSYRSCLVLSLGTIPGCMTISSQDHYWSHSADAWMFMCLPELWIYGGTVNEACLIGSAFFIPGLIDLPLCLAADTLLLPLTVYQQITYTPPEKPRPEQGAYIPDES